MTKFDLYVEKREEARMKRRNEVLNLELLESLRTRTKAEIVESLLGELVIPLGVSTILQTTGKTAELSVF